MKETIEQKEKKQCDHQWKLAFTQCHHFVGIDGIIRQVEYVYFFCEKCLRIKKVKVENDSEVENSFWKNK